MGEINERQGEEREDRKRMIETVAEWRREIFYSSPSSIPILRERERENKQKE